MSDEKWMCSLCTYLNWNASQKCVICHNDRLTNTISQEIYNLDNIYRSLPPSSVSGQNPSENRNKWACPACTYLNWPKARKCVQCNTTRSKHSSPTLSQTSVSSEDQGCTMNKSQSGKVSKETSPDGCQKSDDIKATSSEHLISSDNTSEQFNLTKALHKWICQSCTYENWPKSKCCVMCRVMRNNAKLPDCSSHTEPKHKEEVADGNSTSKGRQSVDRQSLDLLWLEACTSVISGNLYAFESYLLAVDGKLDRELSVQDCRILNQSDVFKPGLTLLDLACKMGRDDFIELYLSTPCSGTQQTSSGPTLKHRMPCHINPDRAMAIQAYLYETMRMRKGDFPCYVIQDHSTFWLPAEIELLPLLTRCQLFDELVDKNVLRELEVNEKVINWWAQSTTQNRLTALWNRTAGDCLLDSVFQATWGILDRDNILRTALAESMREAQHIFYPRWREYEGNQARAFNYTINEFQFQRDWQNLLQIACQQGEPLEQVHIFVLCHIFRRPIIVYGVKFINNYRNEPVGLAHFQGVYLPLLWEKSFCSRNPIVLGYTRGHFSALVPSETPLSHPSNAPPALRSHPGTIVRNQHPHDSSHGGVCSITGSCLTGLGTYGGEAAMDQQTVHVAVNSSPSVCLLPLYDCNKQLLPIHFLTEDESHRTDSLLRDWLDVAITRRGFLMARMRSARRHPLLAGLIDTWLDYYRTEVSDDDDAEGACSQNIAITGSRLSPQGAAQYRSSLSNSQSSDHHHQQQLPTPPESTDMTPRESSAADKHL